MLDYADNQTEEKKIYTKLATLHTRVGQIIFTFEHFKPS